MADCKALRFELVWQVYKKLGCAKHGEILKPSVTGFGRQLTDHRRRDRASRTNGQPRIPDFARHAGFGRRPQQT